MGMQGVAAPVMDRTGAVVASLDVVGVKMRMTDERMHDIKLAVKTGALEISHSLSPNDSSGPKGGGSERWSRELLDVVISGLLNAAVYALLAMGMAIPTALPRFLTWRTAPLYSVAGYFAFVLLAWVSGIRWCSSSSCPRSSSSACSSSASPSGPSGVKRTGRCWSS